MVISVSIAINGEPIFARSATNIGDVQPTGHSKYLVDDGSTLFGDPPRGDMTCWDASGSGKFVANIRYKPIRKLLGREPQRHGPDARHPQVGEGPTGFRRTLRLFAVAVKHNGLFTASWGET